MRFVGVMLAVLAYSAVAWAGPSIEEARSLYFQANVTQAEALFQAIAGDPARTPVDRAKALRGLARIHWVVDGDAAHALSDLAAALKTGDEPCASDLLYNRIARESGRVSMAIARGRVDAMRCAAADEARNLKRELLNAELDLAAQTSGAPRRHALSEAATLLRTTSDSDAVDPDIQRLNLELGLQLGDVARALEAWRGFFWLTTTDAPSGLKVGDKPVTALFADGLRPDATTGDQIALLRLLIRGGFYTQAQRFDAAHSVAERAGHDPAYKLVAAYYEYRSAIARACLLHDRATARGHEDADTFHSAVIGLTVKLAHIIDPAATDPRPPLEQAFSLVGTEGKTSGYESLHVGHLVEDNLMSVDQFGRHGEVRFRVIDNMVANGFQSWLWDGDASTGGWSSDGLIVQVRGAYATGTLAALASLDPKALQRADARQAALDAADRAALQSASVAYLPGVDARLMRHANEQVAAAVRTQIAQSHQPFNRAFVEAYWNASVDHSIRAHEGRHALDNLQFTGTAALSSPELEYRAKLSELELAAYPRLALYNILSDNIGDQTSHGIANARVIGGLAQWMAAHAQEIAGYDAGQPALLQLDRLSDDQMRAYAKSVDPHFLAGK